MPAPSASREYELLVADIIRQLAAVAGVDTESVLHDRVVQGKATANQLDVVWDFRDAAGSPRRVVFEAKQYKRPVEQGRLHALSNVVRDIQDEQRPVTGVMVTTTGYQRGARAVAETYELLVLELREPEERDWHGRIRSTEIIMHAQMPVITDLRIEASKSAEDAGTSKLVVLLEHLMLLEQDKAPRRLVDVLTADELGPLGQPRPPHPVRREFSPPAPLHDAGRWVADVVIVEATVGDESAPPLTITIDGVKDVAYVIRNALSGARVWLAHDGRAWTTDT